MADLRVENESPPPPVPGRFSLERLSSAFARLMGSPSPPASMVERPQIALVADDDLPDPAVDEAPVTPRMIVEGLLFVGAADGRALASSDIAAHIRNVTADEVDGLLAELNEHYRRDAAAYEVVTQGGASRLQVREEFADIRGRLRGSGGAAKLSPAALEVLALVAYRQPITGEQVNRLRGAQSYSILTQLVRRQLVRVERPTKAPAAARYHTTDRFNRLFGVNSAADLPRNEDLDDF